MSQTKSFVIFGAGKRGRGLLSLLGDALVYCFCDNHVFGETVDGKTVVNFEELSALSHLHTILLSTDNEEMRKQLADGGIDYVDCSKNNYDLHELLAEEYEYCMDSEVEFYFVDSFEFTHYEPIYHALRDAGIRAVMVAEPACFNSAGAYFDAEKTWELLEKNKIEWYKRSNPCTKVAITTEFGDNLAHYNCKKVQLCYGVSFLKKKAFELEEEVTRPFDHILVNGGFYKKMISKNRPAQTITDIAYPRYKDHFRHTANREEILRKFEIHTDKPILIYYPTWDDHSSIKKYANEIGRLRDEYYVISKPHHCTMRLSEKKGDMELLRSNSDLVIDTTGSLSELATITDLAICDSMSGAMCEVAYLNRNAHMLAIMEPGTKDEFYIDPEKLAVIVDDPIDLEERARTLRDNDSQLVSRCKLMSELISDDFDAGMDRCIRSIQELCK